MSFLKSVMCCVAALLLAAIALVVALVAWFRPEPIDPFLPATWVIATHGGKLLVKYADGRIPQDLPKNIGGCADELRNPQNVGRLIHCTVNIPNEPHAVFVRKGIYKLERPPHPHLSTDRCHGASPPTDLTQTEQCAYIEMRTDVTVEFESGAQLIVPYGYRGKVFRLREVWDARVMGGTIAEERRAPEACVMIPGATDFSCGGKACVVEQDMAQCATETDPYWEVPNIGNPGGAPIPRCLKARTGDADPRPVFPSGRCLVPETSCPATSDVIVPVIAASGQCVLPPPCPEGLPGHPDNMCVKREWVAFSLQSGSDSVGFSTIRDVEIVYPGVGIELVVDAANTWINDNEFQSLRIMWPGKTFIDFVMEAEYGGERGFGINNNYFENIMGQADPWSTEFGAKNIRHDGNTFVNVKFWDLEVPSLKPAAQRTRASVHPDARDTLVLGGFMTVHKTGVPTIAKFEDKGARTQIIDDSQTILGGYYPSSDGAVHIQGSHGQRTSIRRAMQLLKTKDRVPGSPKELRASRLIPPGSLVLGVTTLVMTDLGSGLSNISIGDAQHPCRWGQTGVTGRTTSDIDQYVTASSDCEPAVGPLYYPAVTDVVITGDKDFNDIGEIRVTVHYIDLTAPTS